jgi:hypothetical protein
MTFGPLRDRRIAHVIRHLVGPTGDSSELAGHKLVAALRLGPNEEAFWCRDDLRVGRPQSFRDFVGGRARQKARPLHTGVKSDGRPFSQ